jgi:ribosome-associated toxin RatA of RatAB toxin-antitoxin module
VPRKINFTKLVEADRDEVYKQISNFENYSSYVPGCSSSKLLEKNDEFEIGELEFDFLLKNYSIKSRNVLSDDAIKIQQIEGPFNFFNGEWTITQNEDDKTEVTFKGEFELPFLLNNLLSANIIDTFCDLVIDAFIERLSKS